VFEVQPQLSVEGVDQLDSFVGERSQEEAVEVCQVSILGAHDAEENRILLRLRNLLLE